MLGAIEAVLMAERPDAVLVYGDTNSTLAGALAAAKLHIPLAHVEAGLRSFNRKMPEEINRVLTDHVSTLLLCPTELAVKNLRDEGVRSGVHLIGDVMFDVALKIADRAEAKSKFRDTDLQSSPFILATVHRAENTDDPVRLVAILAALAALSTRHPVVFPMHPRTRAILAKRSISVGSGIRLIDPVGLVDMTWLERHAALVVTDSGGVQKEAYFHGTPCVTVRTETEWVETVTAGWNRLADPSQPEAIVAAATAALDQPRPTTRITEYGSGNAASKAVELLMHALS
jgi:UDP-GlcNAc3NAcA epimerase